VVAALLVLLLAGGWWLIGRRRTVPIGVGASRGQAGTVWTLNGPGPGMSPGEISGRAFTPEGAPVQAAVVTLEPLGSAASGGEPALASSDASGAFHFAAVPPGQLRIVATHPEHGVGIVAPITLATGQSLAGVDITLRGGDTRLIALVSDSGGGPISGAVALLRLLDDGEDSPALAYRSDDQGQFVAGLASGHYEVVIGAAGYATSTRRLRVKGRQQERFQLSPASVIGGRVLEKGTGAAVPGADVLADQERGPQRRATTGEDGRFSFNALETGVYIMSARKGHLRGQAEFPVRVGTGKRQDDVVITADRGLAIAGQIEGLAGASPATGLKVTALKVGTGGVRWIRYDGTIEPGGQFEIAGLDSGWYRVEATFPGRPAARGSVGLRRNVTGLLLRFQRGGRVSGRVLDAQGRPVAGAKLAARSCSDRLSLGCLSEVAATSGEDGHFTLGEMAAGFLWVQAEFAKSLVDFGPKPLAADEDLNLELRLTAGGRVLGTVRRPDGALAGGVVVRAGRHRATTTNQGRYEMGPLPAGDYTVEAVTSSEQPFVPPSASRQVHLDGGETKEGVDLVVEERRGRLQGTVVSAARAPLEGAVVSVFRVFQGVVFGGHLEGTATTSGDGSFDLGGLPEGPVQVTASLPGYGTATVRASTGRPVTLRLGQGLTLRGHVEDRSGTRMSSYVVALRGVVVEMDPYEAASRSNTREPISRLRVESASGEFKFEDLSAGTYEVLVTTYTRSGGHVAGIQLSDAASNSEVVVVIKPNVRLHGRVVDGKTRAGLPEVEVAVEFGTGELTAPTDPTGEFIFSDAVAGDDFHVHLKSRTGEYVAETFFVTIPNGTDDYNAGELPMIRPHLGNRPATGVVGWTLEARVPTGTKVAAVNPGGLAARNQVTPGSVFQTVDGVSVAGLGQGAVRYYLSGPPDTLLEVVLVRIDGGRQQIRYRRPPWQ
jgi:Carboxypeptidase regulatory-like domain